MKFYYIYKVTNKINGKIYVGIHKTTKLDDGYMGSGKYIKRAINKHGIEHFEKEILEMFNSQEEMYKREAELVNKNFVKDKNTYNLKVGGEGSWDYINSDSEKQRIKCIKGNLVQKTEYYTNPLWCKKRSKKISDSMKEQYKNGRKTNDSFIYGFKGKKHTPETKRKIAMANSIHQKGEGNSQYGTRWIYNVELKENKKVKEEELQECINNGWKRGRKNIFGRIN